MRRREDVICRIDRYGRRRKRGSAGSNTWRSIRRKYISAAAPARVPIIVSRRWWWRHDHFHFFRPAYPPQERPFHGGPNDARASPLLLLELEVVPMLDKIAFFRIEGACNELGLRNCAYFRARFFVSLGSLGYGYSQDTEGQLKQPTFLSSERFRRVSVSDVLRTVCLRMLWRCAVGLWPPRRSRIASPVAALTAPPNATRRLTFGSDAAGCGSNVALFRAWAASVAFSSRERFACNTHL